VQLAQLVELALGDVLRREPRGAPFGANPRGVEVLHVVGRETDDPDAAVGDVLDDPLGGELLERLADRRLADTQRAREPLLTEPLARWDAPLEDLDAQPIGSPPAELTRGLPLLRLRRVVYIMHNAYLTGH